MCSLEGVCLTLGIHQILFSSLGVLGCIGGIVAINLAAYKADDQLVGYEKIAVMDGAYVTIIALSVALVFSVISLIFASLLVSGISQKKAGYVLAYYVYGIIQCVLGLSASLFIVFYARMYSLLIGVFILYGIYIGLMHIVRLTYLKFQNINASYSHKPLV